MNTSHSLQRPNFTDGWFMEKGGVLMTRVRGAGRQDQGPKSRVIFSAFAISRQRQERQAQTTSYNIQYFVVQKTPAIFLHTDTIVIMHVLLILHQ